MIQLVYKSLVFIGVAILTFICTGMACVLYMYSTNYRSFKYDPYVATARYNDYKDLNRREVEFYSGKNKLRGYVYGEENKDMIVFSHGIWSGHEDYMAFLKWFIDRGYAVFAYDYTGYNNSQGDNAKGLTQSMIDLDNALTFIEKDNTLKQHNIYLMGHSWGGYATASVLRYKHNVKAAVPLSGFNDPETISLDVTDKLIGKPAYLLTPFLRLNQYRLFKDKGSIKAVDSINSTNIPVLIVHANKDAFIKFDKTSIIAQKDKITNKNVQYYVITKKHINDHSSYVNDVQSAIEVKRIEKERKKMESKCPNGKATDQQLRKFYAKLDKSKANQPNVELCERIDKFFKSVK
ncbi:alpha/beta hydrolase family protein [Lachnobacterium bovis]|uniref:alpha/beta hydrolase family protein n=1 Tax=Lachnobacterium bovis TaxID=140626 RepID=UPI0003B4A8F9|nr:alpha/beta fold hydrolase [Lachnobacterium bovis]